MNQQGKGQQSRWQWLKAQLGRLRQRQKRAEKISRKRVKRLWKEKQKEKRRIQLDAEKERRLVKYRAWRKRRRKIAQASRRRNRPQKKRRVHEAQGHSTGNRHPGEQPLGAD